MADYREISQTYAREGIRTVIVLNAGAAAALLSQATQLIEKGLAAGARAAMIIWASGATLGVLAWLFAFTSTRYVDKSEREAGAEARHLRTSDRHMSVGAILFLLSLICFGAGAARLALSFG